MEIGVVFPQTEIGADVAAVRKYGQRVEELGYRHLVAYDHVLGADPAVHEGWDRAYDVDTTFHEPLVLFGYLAAITSLELVASVIILPQRETALVAKQAAEVDLLSGGRLRLGVGIGWNRVEYEALGQDFTVRGRRLTEQVGLLRRLWTEKSVTFHGKYDRITGAGLAPLPVQRPIPLWFGAESAPGFRRVGRIGDGWFPQMGPGPDLDAAKDAIAAAATEAGRDPAGIGMHGRYPWRGDPDDLVSTAQLWRDTGATHVSINTMGAGLAGVDDHLAALETAAGALNLR
jgi:probable F420-dependent oxidoreductase